MANKEQIDKIKISLIDRYEENNNNHNDGCVPDVKDAYFRGEDLSVFDLCDFDLSHVDFYKAELIHTNFTNANLEYSSFFDANLSYSTLINTNLCNADLRNSVLNGAAVKGMNVRGAAIGGTEFINMNLSSVKGLDEVCHDGPSVINFETLRLSNGNISEKFLRGCGLSDLEIKFSKLAKAELDTEKVTDILYKIHDLYCGDAIQFHSCFISYSNKDEEFARQLYDNLQNNGVRCWFAPESLKVGDRIRPTIDKQIQLNDKLLVILSENSISSEWVGDEVEAAIEEESKSDRSILFPIRLDSTVFDTRHDWSSKIKRRRYIGDFSKWKEKKCYDQSFTNLLNDLRVSIDVFNSPSS